MSAADTDRAAIAAKFRADLSTHTLDDITGKATLNVRQALRSDLHAEAWHLELLRLQANTPDGEFRTKVCNKMREAEGVTRVLSRKRHADRVTANRPAKSVGSGANLGQMAAMILAAHIEAKTMGHVQATLRDVKELMHGLMNIEDAP